MSRRGLDFEEVGKRGRGRTNMTWKRQVEEHKIELKKMPLTEATFRD